jgi:hypothetical protein
MDTRQCALDAVDDLGTRKRNQQERARAETSVVAATLEQRHENQPPPASSRPTEQFPPVASFAVPPPPHNQQRRRSRAVNEQDFRYVKALREDKDFSEVKLLGGRDTQKKVINYTDCVKYLRSETQGAQPPKGHRAPDKWTPGAEIEGIAKAVKKLNSTPPWLQPVSRRSESLNLAPRD